MFQKLHSQIVPVLLAGLSAALCGCGTAKVANRREIGPGPLTKPAVIYVADFDLDVSDIRADRGILPLPFKTPAPLADLLPSSPLTPKSSEAIARELVDSMSAALVKDINKAGLTARRLRTCTSLPGSGWLVRGVFTSVDQGNQLTRALIGFGAGKTDLQVVVDLNDLTQGPPRPFYELNTTADSGRVPGAAPMIVLSPVGAAARFVIAGKDLNRSVKQTASQIAAEVAQRTRNSL